MAKGLQFDPEISIDANYFQNMLIGIFGYQCSNGDTYKLRGVRGSATSASCPDNRSALIHYVNVDMYQGYGGAPVYIYKQEEYNDYYRVDEDALHFDRVHALDQNKLFPIRRLLGIHLFASAAKASTACMITPDKITWIEEMIKLIFQ